MFLLVQCITKGQRRYMLGEVYLDFNQYVCECVSVCVCVWLRRGRDACPHKPQSYLKDNSKQSGI